MPVTTAAVTSRRARRARRNERTNYYLPSEQRTRPRSNSELFNPASSRCAEESQSTQGSSPLTDSDIPQKTLSVVVAVGVVKMEDGEAQTLAMTTANPTGTGNRIVSALSSNESSPTTTRAPAPGLAGATDDSPLGVERSFKRRRSFSKCLDKHYSA